VGCQQDKDKNMESELCTECFIEFMDEEIEGRQGLNKIENKRYYAFKTSI
jgi:hypothetical protein